jgi:4-amino-4-deoxy-L-arabinose transferase-like glycosyltransferase
MECPPKNFRSEESLAVSAPVDRALAVPESPNPLWDDEILSKWIRRAFWICGLMFGSIAAWASRFSMNVDGISYLDLGNAFLNRDWNAAVNGYWSPLYAVLLGAAVRVFHVSPYWESNLVHAVNFLIFLASMAAFELFLRELSRHQLEVSEGGAVQCMPEWVMQAFGYPLFLYAGLVWISVGLVTPDQFVAAVMYLVAALLLRMRRKDSSWAWYAMLGIFLGVGYLTKAALFPLGLVSLTATLFVATRQSAGARIRRTLVTACLFALVASPLVIVLSRSKGRFTFGDTGQLNYAGFVEGMGQFPYWRGEGNFGTPKHPFRKPSDNPDVYEFATPVGGTYPPWYDTSYWFDGSKGHFNFKGQLRVLMDSARVYAACALGQRGFLFALVALFAAASGGYSFWRGLASAWPIWASAVAGIGMYGLVHVETRLVASFLVIVGLNLLSGIRSIPSGTTRRVVLGLALGVAAITLLGVASVSSGNLYSATFKPRHLQWEVAQALAQRGIRPGDTVATIIDHRIGDYWAHLAQVRIVEDIPREEMPKLIAMDAPSHVELARVLQRPGAKAIVTTPEPPPGTGFRWDRLGQTPYFISMLSPEGSN